MDTAKETGLWTRWPREASEARCWAGTGREAPGCEGRLTCELLGGGRPVLGDAGDADRWAPLAPHGARGLAAWAASAGP